MYPDELGGVGVEAGGGQHALWRAWPQRPGLRGRDANSLVNCMAVYRDSVPCYDALVVIDMQNSFCHEKGALYRPYGEPIPGLPGIVDRNRRLIAESRAHGVPVMFTRQSHRAGYPDIGGALLRHRDLMVASGALLRDSWDAAVIDELAPEPDDVIIDKTRYDAFHGTDLDQLLRGRAPGPGRLLLSGIVTNACVESTARSAAMRDYTVTLVEAGCGSRTTEFHRMSVECMAAFGIVTVDNDPFGGARS